MNDRTGFFFELPFEALRPALLVSLLSVWVLVGLFSYLNRYSNRRYFSIWTAAWLFYGLWLSLNITFFEVNPPGIQMLKHWCVGTSGAFLLWGAVRFLHLEMPQRLFGLFLAFIFVWSYIGTFHLKEQFWIQFPVFGLIGLASGITGFCFARLRRQQEFLGAGLLSVGFFLWGAYLAAYPFLTLSNEFLGTAFFLASVLQLFIAVSMIILVLEEARSSNRVMMQEFKAQKHETRILRRRMLSTEERYRRVFDQASEGIILASADELEIFEMNPRAQQLLGTVANGSARISLLSYLPMLTTGQETASRPGAEWVEMIRRKRQFTIVRRDGSIVKVEIDASPVSLEERDAFQFFVREVTERARLEEQLRQTEKLSALGQMISGIAHELNNPLAVIKGYIELILARHELPVQTRTDLDKVAHESNRAAKLVSNFLSFARERPVERRQVDLNALIERVLELRRFDLQKSGVRTELNLDPDLPLTDVDSDQIQQVLVNLINNSMHALRAATCPAQLRILSSRTEGQIQVVVEDNGPGIAESLSGRIFEPFFTTKEVGKGTGLGLSIAHSIVAEHEGRIYHRAVPGGGAAFVLELPVVTRSLASAADPSTVPATPLSAASLPSARILILDDEQSLAELLGEMLALLGHRPTLCFSAPAALQLLDQQPFDLVLSDFRMPGMDGRQFYLRAVEKYPSIARRVIFLTGDVVSEETQAFLRSTGNPHLSKPFHLAAVEDAIARVLAVQGANPEGDGAAGAAHELCT